jgi:site-specific DNA-methyltransferase (adenine-specific)
MSEYELYFGNCLEVMKHLPDASVDMVLADLPYGTTQCAWDVIIPFESLWREYLRIAKPEAAIVLCAAQPFASLVVASNPKHYRYEWIWEKGNATGFLNAKKQPLRAHESAQVFYRQQPVYNPQMSTGHERKTSSGRRSTLSVTAKHCASPSTTQLTGIHARCSSSPATSKPVAFTQHRSPSP